MLSYSYHTFYFGILVELQVAQERDTASVCSLAALTPSIYV